MASIVASEVVAVGLGNATSYPPDTTFSYSGAAGNVLIVAVHGTDRTNAGGISDVTCQVDGVDMTPLAGAIHSGGDGFPLFRMFAATGLSAGNKSITAFFRGRACITFAMEVSGLDDSDLVANTSVLESANATYSHSYTPNAADNLIISTLATQGGSGGSFSPDTGMTEELDEFTGTTATSDVGAWVGYRTSPGTSAIDVGATPVLNEQLVFTVVEFNAAGGGGSTSVAPTDAAQATSASSPTVSSLSVVAPNDGVHATSSTQPTVAAESSVSPSDAVHSVASTQPDISSVATVSPDNAANENTASSPAITQPGVVAPNSAIHAVLSSSPAVISEQSGPTDYLEPLADAVPFKRREFAGSRATIESIMRPLAVVAGDEVVQPPVVREAIERQQEFEERIEELQGKLARARTEKRIESLQAQINQIEERAEMNRMEMAMWIEDEAAALLLLAAA